MSAIERQTGSRRPCPRVPLGEEHRRALVEPWVLQWEDAAVADQGSDLWRQSGGRRPLYKTRKERSQPGIQRGQIPVPAAEGSRDPARAQAIELLSRPEPRRFQKKADRWRPAAGTEIGGDHVGWFDLLRHQEVDDVSQVEHERFDQGVA